MRFLLVMSMSIALSSNLHAQATPGAKPGSAEANEQPETPVRPSVTPPELVDFAAAPYPEGALGESVNVVVFVTVGIEGQVSDVAIAQGAGAPFDSAALAAARRCRFKPALRDGTPVAARISLSYEFAPPVAEQSPAASPSDAPVDAAPAASSANEISPASPPPVAPPRTQSVEVTVQGKSDAERLRESSRAVKVVETQQAKRQSADLGEVLARTEGVGVRRGGGLGSSERISLGGLTDEQIRFLVDGLPLEFGGYGSSVSSIPVNFIERVEIYQGVVPIQFGSDALGGAVNVVTQPERPGDHASLSQEIGSFGTYRTTLGAQRSDAPSGLYLRTNAFLDRAENDFPVDVEVPDDRGQLHAVTVRRFHDAYAAHGIGAELGVVGRPWARRLALRGFANEFDKEIQHNVVMTVPYGEVVWGQATRGATLRYDQRLGRGVFFDGVAGYAYTTTYYRDQGDCVYDWFGHCGLERQMPGEVESDAKDQEVYQHLLLLRPTLTQVLLPGHTLRMSLSANVVKRSGRDAETREDARDPLNARRDLYTLVSGLEYELDAFDDRLENTVFAKHYLQHADTQEVLAGGFFLERQRNTSAPGIGDSLRFRFTDFLYAKASYEWATRLPRPDEVFGDGAQIVANTDLEPERSHNGNIGLAFDLTKTAVGDVRVAGNGFVRDAHQMIVLLGKDQVFSYQNVYGARSLGWEAAAGWTSPREYLSVDGNLTWQSFRNTSSKGTFGDFEGDRIPNRPWLFANLSAIAKVKGVISARDELSVNWHSRYVKGFFRSWESVGLREFKHSLPSQLLHTVALTYRVEAAGLHTSSTVEVQNVSDEHAFDFYGVQKPGRAFFWKGTLEL